MFKSSREDFNKTWLTEMPEIINPTDLYDMIEYSINDRIKLGEPVVDLNNGLKKLEGDTVVYYWYENNNQDITLGAEFSKAAQSLIVNMIGKKEKGRPPFASDLYTEVLADANKQHRHSIRISSDIKLSDEGFNIWAKLLQNGLKISVYDAESPGKSFTTINSVKELEKYVSPGDANYQRYQYILSEDHHSLAETRGYFNTRRMRELSGLL